MPPCRSCNTERSNEQARFCSNCGASLETRSTYEEIINKDISVLSLTKDRISSIKNNSKIRNIKDILHDLSHKELRSIPQVGEYWAKRIFNLAEEYIS
ncbi:hypothetical protein AVI51_16715 (plasmid) [Piscirickettsia salmonis]|nr:zinc ribbon domain-containing protein [Piscirickettsia salmonis]ERL61878.1 hypothetical protein K661_01791 [Piscirickettsia salmonis LF-89 = ATCC VR-1361]APS45913.1 hypothetical protein AVI48_15880 [Piscirickettsia salmonis]APS49299.1 hypothetical protein AVI49_16705 [Piscirickettsia salmonis]APS52505.1 hypothetical protein AVI50_16775 [Piscirickettsia salmonis]APS55744.1 hypothetical protein AVI51_16715 [Piscirickettsia salmonis]